MEFIDIARLIFLPPFYTLIMAGGIWPLISAIFIEENLGRAKAELVALRVGWLLFYVWCLYTIFGGDLDAGVYGLVIGCCLNVLVYAGVALSSLRTQGYLPIYFMGYMFPLIGFYIASKIVT